MLLRRKLLMTFLISPLLTAQSTTPNLKPMFFHGTVRAVEGETVIIFRKLVGHKPEIRTFVIRAGTSINTALAPNQDVTVRYVRSDDGDVALDIRVHRRARAAS